MKFVRLVTVCVTFAAMTVMSGFDCAAPEQTSECRPGLQQVQFVGYDGCQDIVFCDETSAITYKSRSAGVPGYELGLKVPQVYALPDAPPEDKAIYLNAWLYISEAGQVCARPVDQALIDQGAPTDKVVNLAVTFTPANAAGVVLGTAIDHNLQIAVQTLDFAPAVSNATYQVQMGDRNVAVFVQPTAVTELKLQANLTQTPAAGTISYQLPEMPATMTTVPAANTEAIVSVSQGIAVGDRAIVKATLEADGETIEREAEVRVVARSDDPILEVQQRATVGCSASCAGENTSFHQACFSTAGSIASVDGTQSVIRWSSKRAVRDSNVVPRTEVVFSAFSSSGEFSVCYSQEASPFTIVIEAESSPDTLTTYAFEFDPSAR